MKIYFIFVMMFCFGLMGVFALLGSNGILRPFPAIVGIIMSIVGAIGGGMEMNRRSA